ncbi:MAG: glycoside hydrolase family protein [Lentisphaeria bacterium]|nr:glycoside hydrolase family protein [Lentisphaeria bacterium]
MRNEIHRRIDRVPRDNGYQDENFWVWGSTVVKADDGLYHMYVSRWSRELPFHPGWMTDCEIAHCTAEKVTGPYTFSDVALGKRGAQYWDGQSTHNPKVVRHGDTYLLFYMGSTHPFESFFDAERQDTGSKHCIVGRANKRVGVAVADSPYGPWIRQDEPILPTRPGTFYSFLTSNPSAVVHADGSVLLMFKARAHEGDTHGEMTIGIAKAPHYLGPYTVVNEKPLFGPGNVGVIEDPSMWLDNQGYHMLAKDMSGAISGEKHAGILCHSDNGIDWEVDASPKAYSKEIVWEDGETGFFGQMERVFPYVEDDKLTTLFFAVMDGGGGFHKGKRSWNIAIPLTMVDTV